MKLFVTGGTGFIGAAFVPLALSAGHSVHLLTRSEEAAAKWRERGVTPVLGDLRALGDWQRGAAECDALVHLAQPETFGARITQARADAYRENRLRMDSHLLETLGPGHQRVLYVGGTSYIGEQGKELRDETVTPNPKGWGPYIAPAIEKVGEYRRRGLPIVEAFPGAVYGPGSWFAEYGLRPLKEGRRVLGVRGPSRYTSAIHLMDCARALLHLLEHGEAGQRYFLVDDEPVRFADLVRCAADALGVPLQKLLLPKLLIRLAMGPVVLDSVTTEYRLSNARLRATGFRCEFPTVREGVPDVVRRWLAQRGEG